MRDALRAEQRNNVACNPPEISDLRAPLLRPTAFAENPAGFQLCHIQLAQLLHGDRLAGAVPIFKRIVALGDFGQRLDCQHPRLFSSDCAVATELHPAPDIVGVAIVDEVGARAGGQHERAKALQIAAPNRILPVSRLSLVDDGFRQFWHMHLARAGPENSPKTHQQIESCGVPLRSLEYPLCK